MSLNHKELIIPLWHPNKHIIGIFNNVFLLLYFSEPSCSQTISGEHSEGVLQSYNYPFDYTHNLTCHYNIHVPGGSNSNKIICFNFQRYV